MRHLTSFGPLAAWLAFGLPLTLSAAEPTASADTARIELKRDDNQGTLQVLLGGREATGTNVGGLHRPGHIQPQHAIDALHLGEIARVNALRPQQQGAADPGR